MSDPTPLIDRRRSTSKDRLPHSSHPASNPSSPFGSPIASPPLKSALRHYQDPFTSVRPNDGDEHVVVPMELPPPVTSDSPALASTYSRRVGFDTFVAGASLEALGSATGGGTGVNYSFTISAKSAKFVRTKASRTFLVGTDLNEYSVHALNWLLSSLTEDHDEVVILRVIEPASGVALSERQLEECREEAEDVLEQVMQKNGGKRQISIIVEFAIGPIEETIHRMLEIYKPDSLVVGTRGRPEGFFKGAFMGSISKYCVAKSPVPVVVVRPEDKVKEALSRRIQDPKKRSYVSLLNPHERVALERSTTMPAGVGLGADLRERKSEEFERPLKTTGEGKAMQRFGTIG